MDHPTGNRSRQVFRRLRNTRGHPNSGGTTYHSSYQGVDLSANAASNSNEMSCYSARLSENTNIIAGIIGNETLLRGDLTEPALTSLINQARQSSSAPVSTAETWDVWCNLSSQKPRCPGRTLLGGSVDFIMANVYPYWEGVSIEHAAAHVMAIYIALSSAYPVKKIIIGEAGWPTCGNMEGNAIPSLTNQKRFISELWRWSNLYDVQVVYFEAFDEPWKVNSEGQVGGCWGIYDVNRVPKHNDLLGPCLYLSLHHQYHQCILNTLKG